MFDLKGKEVIPVIYDSLIPKEMKDGGFILLATTRDIFFSVLTKEGKVIVPENFYTYIEIEDYLEQGIIPVYREGKVGLYNLEGKELLPIKFDKLWLMRGAEVIAKVFYKGKSFYIDREGKCVEDCQNAPKK